MGYIYLLTEIETGIQYIGKTNGNNKKYFTSGLIPNRIIAKHGKTAFEKIILEDNIDSIDLLNEKEKLYIKFYNSFENGYNLTIGGDGGGHWIYKLSDEEKKDLAERKREKMLGRTFSDSTLEKMSIAKKGVPLKDSHIQNIKNSMTDGNHPWQDRKHSEISKIKIGDSRRGKKCPSYLNLE